MTRCAVLLCGLVLLLAGCGSSGSSSSKAESQGDKVFADAGCGNCHTFEAAGAHGKIGPDLDQLQPDAATVARQVREGGNGMPSFEDKLSAEEIQQVADFVASSSSSSPAASMEFRPSGETVEACAKQAVQGCFRQAFGNVAYRDGPAKALALLATDSARMPAVQADCHQITHTIGHAGLAHYRNDAAEALAHGAMTCNSGYYHGVIELAFRGVPRDRVTRIARTLCASPSVTKQQFLLYQCVHGLGHGLMIYSGDDLPYSLKVCDRLVTSFDRISCTGGVFMQNVLPGMGRSRYLRSDDPLYPCTIVAERHKLYCYLMVTARILELDGYDWKRTAVWCRRSEARWVATCFQSYGRDASGASNYVPRETARLCLIAGKDAGDCFYGAARDYANNYAGGTQAARLCVSSPDRYRAPCYRGIGTILGAIHADRAGRRAACAASVPPRYLVVCYAGAAAL